MITRTPINTGLPLSLDEAKAHARVDHDEEDALVETLIRAAASDIEALAGLALLPQSVTMTTEDIPGCAVSLPVGPMQTGAAIEVLAVNDDGTVTAMTTGWWIETGRYPVLHLDPAPTTRLRLTWTAQLVATAADMPADLRLAMADQVLRAFDERGGAGAALSAQTARVIARYRRVRL